MPAGTRPTITAPGFPHGEDRGYTRGCGCAPCRAGHSKAVKVREIRRQQGRLVARSMVDRADEVRRHVDWLIQTIPASSVQTVADAAGVSQSALSQFLNGTATKVSAFLATKVLPVTAEQVAAARQKLPVAEYRDKTRQMQAAGWGIGWQEAQLGIADLGPLRPTAKTITRTTATAIDALYRRIGFTLATPANSGQDQRVIDQTKKAARALGYYPPGCYDDNGHLDPRATPDHPWAKIDERAARNLDALRARVIDGLTVADAAATLHLTERMVDRVVASAGMTDPARRDSVRAQIVATVAAYDSGDLDVVTAALHLHLIDPHFTPRDHPGYLAWLETRATAEQPTGDRLGTAA